MKIVEKEYNVITGVETITERDETAVETKQRLDFIKQMKEQQEAAAAKETARKAVLEKLGLTADEAAALLS